MPSRLIFICTLLATSLMTGVLKSGKSSGQDAPAALESPKKPGSLSPAESLARFKTPDDLRITQVLAEPQIAQPVFINFDERGRLWVAEYRQYPEPAGLKMLSRDQYWRAVYDKIPPAPPHHDRGLDRITIHADTDGDGIYDQHKVFLDGLNIATAFAQGRGGVWVLHPPYLLFYADRDRDDLPDGDPEVHLEGFGLEDTHSVVNSLTWGPDGWLYAAQGSTVTGNVRRPGAVGADGKPEAPVHSLGQLIWRYHPEQKKYEIFAEGGGNAFGVEIDSKGRIFSGHNGGDTRGFHYVQGGYSQKGFTKHGPLSNPFAFGYFPPLKHHTVPRFTHTWLIYEGDALPEGYRGQLFGVAPLLSHVVRSEIKPLGSTWETRDLGLAVETSDEWFRPVDIKLGPDGALYIADWYDGQISHLRNQQGELDRTNGRVYRLSAAAGERAPLKPFDLAALPTSELVAVLEHPNRWQRQTALRLLYDRRDTSAIAQLKQLLSSSNPQTALEALWGLHASGGFDDALALEALTHSDPFVRLWTVRLLADGGLVSPKISARLAALARTEPNVEVRSQLACSARRLPTADCLPIAQALMSHAEDATDPHLPLLIWWALEANCGVQREAVLAIFDTPDVWREPVVAEQILPRLMKRFAQAGTRADLLICAQLFRDAPDAASNERLLQGFAEAFAGRSMASLPDDLVAAIPANSPFAAVLGVRRGDPQAVAAALESLGDDKTPPERRIELAQLFGEVKQSTAVDALLAAARQDASDQVRQAATASLGLYDDDRVVTELLPAYDSMTGDLREVTHALFAGRPKWTIAWLTAMDQKKITREHVPTHFIRRLQGHANADVASLAQRIWPLTGNPTSAELQVEIDRHASTIGAGSGDPYAGKKLFTTQCAKCHTLFGAGGKVGPDLTSFKRTDLPNMLLAVVNPSAEIREGFETFTAVTDDGRIATGLLVDQDQQVVVLRGADGQTVSLARNEIDEMAAAKVSIMPDGLLKDYSEQQVRDLFAYLRSTQPLNN